MVDVFTSFNFGIALVAALVGYVLLNFSARNSSHCLFFRTSHSTATGFPLVREMRAKTSVRARSGVLVRMS